MSAQVEAAGKALWADDARKQPHLDLEALWPRVSEEYMRRATIALSAARTAA